MVHKEWIFPLIKGKIVAAFENTEIVGRIEDQSDAKKPSVPVSDKP